ncbi:MAG: heparinase II/III family protein [Clostridia bacterium]|nr:heparinase II/III family protein [Clostridia bacterium]
MLDFAKDKALWQKVRESEDFATHRAQLLALYEEAFRVEPRAHSVEDILSQNDHMLWRKQFDHLQTSALLTLIYPENEEYYNNLLRTIWAYCNEYSWAPLGHFTMQYYGKTPADFDPGLIDIFAASVGFALAEVKNLLGDRLPRLISDRISYEIRRHIIEPYCTRTFFWESHDNNWTAVCAGAVGGVLMYEAPHLFYEHQTRLHNAMECYLASFLEDGMCVEGVGYWGFGFGFFAAYASLERELTQGAVDWFARPKVKAIAQYLQKMFLQRNVLTTFGDCTVFQRIPIGLPHLLRHVYGDEIEPLPRMPGCVEDNTHFNFALRSIIYYDPAHVSGKMRENVTYAAENSSYFVKRTPYYGFATKGGHNGESHNHIDVGTFILARHDRQILADIGAGPYEDGYHTERRYTFFHPSSYSHSIPMLDGVGEDSIARDRVVVHYDSAKDTATMDIAGAYGRADLTSLTRAFAFAPDCVTLTDRYTLTSAPEITERFVALMEPIPTGDGLVIDDVVLTNPHGIAPKITAKKVRPHPDGEPHDVFLIDYVLPAGQTEFTLRMAVAERS